MKIISFIQLLAKILQLIFGCVESLFDVLVGIVYIAMVFMKYKNNIKYHFWYRYKKLSENIKTLVDGDKMEISLILHTF